MSAKLIKVERGVTIGLQIEGTRQEVEERHMSLYNWAATDVREFEPEEMPDGSFRLLLWVNKNRLIRALTDRNIVTMATANDKGKIGGIKSEALQLAQMEIDEIPCGEIKIHSYGITPLTDEIKVRQGFSYAY